MQADITILAGGRLVRFIVCPICRALVLDHDLAAHAEWHEETARAAGTGGAR